MLYLITGASGSGKSEYAEKLVCALAEKEKITEKIYLATMENHSRAAKKRIARHRKLREGKGFLTVEAPCGFPEGAQIEKKEQILLLECLSNLLANLMFKRQMSGKKAETEILSQLEKAAAGYRHVVVVTNEIFSDGVVYTDEMQEYLRALGRINCQLAQSADLFCEVVYSIPVFLKGEAVCLS